MARARVRNDVGYDGARRADDAFMARPNGPVKSTGADKVPPTPLGMARSVSDRAIRDAIQPTNRSLECSGCPFLFRRDRLGLFHWLGLKRFERDDFLRPGP